MERKKMREDFFWKRKSLLGRQIWKILKVAEDIWILSCLTPQDFWNMMFLLFLTLSFKLVQRFCKTRSGIALCEQRIGYKWEEGWEPIWICHIWHLPWDSDWLKLQTRLPSGVSALCVGRTTACTGLGLLLRELMSSWVWREAWIWTIVFTTCAAGCQGRLWHLCTLLWGPQVRSDVCTECIIKPRLPKEC